MSDHGGKRSGAGRPKGSKEGSPTKRNIRREMTERIIAEQRSEGVMPLEVMLSAMRDEWMAGNKRLAAEYAKDAAPYCHAKLAAVEHKGDTQHPLQIMILSGVPRADEEHLNGSAAEPNAAADDERASSAH